MICTACNDDGVTSKVFKLGGERTLLGTLSEFYDEEGNYHKHDPNTVTYLYKCENDHDWTEVVSLPCPFEGCEFNEEA